jgi:hypothetical protein
MQPRYGTLLDGVQIMVQRALGFRWQEQSVGEETNLDRVLTHGGCARPSMVPCQTGNTSVLRFYDCFEPLCVFAGSALPNLKFTASTTTPSSVAADSGSSSNKAEAPQSTAQ